MASKEFIEMVNREYGEMLKRHIKRMVGRDDCDYVYNTVLIRLWREVDEKEIREIPKYLMRMATNECKRFLKEERKNNVIYLDDYV